MVGHTVVCFLLPSRTRACCLFRREGVRGCVGMLERVLATVKLDPLSRELPVNRVCRCFYLKPTARWLEDGQSGGRRRRACHICDLPGWNCGDIVRSLCEHRSLWKERPTLAKDVFPSDRTCGVRRHPPPCSCYGARFFSLFFTCSQCYSA